MGLVAAAVASPAFAADNSVRQWPAVNPDRVERRALIIANGRYAGATLQHAGRDGRLLGRALSGAGFDVLQLDNADRRTMDRHLERFARDARRAGNRGIDQDDARVIGLVYFTGYGVQMAGTNYLLPVDSGIRRASDIPRRAIALPDVVRLLEASAGQGRPMVLLVDAAYEGGIVAGTAAGLGAPYAPHDVIVGLSQQPGDLVRTQLAGSSRYAEALADVIGQSGVFAGSALLSIDKAVEHASGGIQRPWRTSGIAGEFRLTARPEGADVFSRDRDSRLPAAGRGVSEPSIDRPVVRRPGLSAPDKPGPAAPDAAPAPESGLDPARVIERLLDAD